jgi:hypothetical protein
MRRFNFMFSIFALLLLTLPLLTTVPAFSAEPANGTAPAARTDPSAEASAKAEGAHSKGLSRDAGRAGRGTQKDKKPQIIIDQKTDTVRVLIDGKEIVTIDAHGLHVNGDIEYNHGSLKPIPGLPPPISATPESPPRPDRTLTDQHHGVDDGAHRP